MVADVAERLGRATTAYYIEGVSLADARQLFQRGQRPNQGMLGFFNRRKLLKGGTP